MAFARNASLPTLELKSHHCRNQVHVRTLADGTQVYETQLDVTSSPTPFETDFFAKLDQQLNKVNAFYRSKEAEFVQQGEVLKKQIEAFLEMKDTVDQSKGKSANAGKNSSGQVLCLQLSPVAIAASCPRLESKPGWS